MNVDTDRLRRRWRLLTIMQAVNISLFVGMVLIVMIWRSDDSLMSQLFLYWGPIYVVTSLYILFFRCPRCRKLFHYRLWLYANWPYRSACLHCGLPRGCMDPVEIESPLAKEYMPPLAL